MLIVHRLGLLLVAVLPLTITGFSAPPAASTKTTITTAPLYAFYNDFEDGFGGSDDSETEDLYASLRQRQASLEEAKIEGLKVWRKPQQTTLKAIPIQNDWVRRIALDSSAATYQDTVVAGGASGSLYLVDVTTGETISTLDNVHRDRSPNDNVDLLQYLYGNYDGGGLVAIARKDNLVASSGREGGVLLSMIVHDKSGQQELKQLGRIGGIDAIATSLFLDQNDILWVGTFENKRVRGFSLEELDTEDFTGDQNSMSLSLEHNIQMPSKVLSLHIQEEIGCGVATTTNDGIVLFSLADGSILSKWNPFQSTKEFARSALIVQNDAEAVNPTRATNPPSWSVVVGGSKGSLRQQRLSVNQQKRVEPGRIWNPLGKPHEIPKRYCHQGSVVCMASPGPGILLSAGQDGTLRVWDVSYFQKTKECPVTLKFEEDRFLGGVFGTGSKPTPLSGMAGYKVWLGSLVLLNDNLLVTDGADNCVVAHYFGEEVDEEGDH